MRTKTQITTISATKSRCISYYDMRKSARILRDILFCYFPIYHLTASDFFNHYPILGFIEALVYQADEEVEAEQHQQKILQKTSCWEAKQKLILSLVKELNIEHWSIHHYVENLGKFYNLETQVITSQKFTHADISQVNELRSSDYRILHSILIQSLGKTYDEGVFAVMWPIEVVAEIYDDIDSYEKDVAAGNFNTYDLFLKIYGAEAQQHLEAEMNRYENLFDDLLNQLPESERQRYSYIWQQMRQIYPRPPIPQPICSYGKNGKSSGLEQRDY